ncbi:MAG: glycosyltransferase family 1 protein, partial [Bacteroidota bacterium]
FWLDLPVKFATVVTAVSETTKQDILKYTQCTPNKIKVIPTIISNHYKPAVDRPKNEKPVLLHIGLAHNKNFERHVEAITGMDVSMHIIGQLESHHIDLLKKHKIDYYSEYNISDDAMQAAYEGCDLLLFASTLEGFGMPIIEAQTVGRPIVTSHLSSMPEVGGEGAYYVDPYEVKSIREGVKEVLENKDLCNRLVDKGFENVKRFQADTIAQQYEELYLKVLDHHGVA